MSTEKHRYNIDPTHPAAEYSMTSFGETINRSSKWVKQMLVEPGLVPYSVVNGNIRLTGESLQVYIDLRNAGDLKDYAVKK